MAVLADIHGNEAREVIAAGRFGWGKDAVPECREKGGKPR